MSMQGVLKIFMAGIAAALTAQPALAQEKLVLRAADPFPPGHYLHRHGLKPWMEAVTLATQGRVQFEHYPAEQLGKAKDLLSLAQAGVADVVLTGAAYHSEKMPLTAALETPGLFTDSCQGARTYQKLAEGVLGEKEYAVNGVRVLVPAIMPTYHVVSAIRKIQSLKDVEGMKLRTLAGAQELTMRKFKAVPVRMPSSELFEAMSRGTVDGAIFSYEGVVNNKLPIKYVTSEVGFGSGAAMIFIAENRWNKLPEEVKKAMLEAGKAATQTLCSGMMREETASLEKLKQAGVTVVRWSAEDKKEMERVMAAVADEWASQMDKRGKPGSQVLKAVLEARDSR